MQTDAETFLKRIRAFPDDDAPRLIFADWLDEQNNSSSPLARAVASEWGPARGRFIRVQIALAQLEEETRDADPAYRSDRDETRSMLQKEQRDLLDTYEDLWSQSLHGLTTRREFRRGFVERVNVDARLLLRRAPELFAAAPLRAIQLLDVGGTLPQVLQVPELSRITQLTIHGEHSRELLARSVASSEYLGKLEVLELTRHEFEDNAAEHLAGSPVLGNLQELDLGENHLGEAGARALAASPYLTSLKKLKLGSNRLGSAGAEALAASERLVGLEELNLSDNEIGSARLQYLGRIHELLRVPVLDLSSNGLTASGLQVLLSPTHGGVLPRIRKLILSNNELGDAGSRVLAACPWLEDLRSLTLASCGIGDEGGRALAQSPYLNRLVALDLSNNAISDPGFQEFLKPSHLRSLQQLIKPAMGISTSMRRHLDVRFRQWSRSSR
jgi:uncharacterized protein (TIGR02996 family)